MNGTFIPFAFPDIGEEEIAEVLDTLRSGWLTTGQKTKQFEDSFQKFIGSDVQAVAVNSGTAGLHLALEAIRLQPGDEVITTTYTFTATAEVIRYLGAHPVFVDIDPNTMNIDVEKIEAAITPRTKAIVPVHFAGFSCCMKPIIQVARKHNLKIIEDAAHAIPTTYSHRVIGSLETDATVFSFYATKTLTTGEGGMIVTNDNELADRCRIMRLHGISRDAFDRYSSAAAPWYYEVVAPGFKYNMNDLAASIGIHQLRKSYDLQKKRAVLAQRYDEAFQNLPLILPPRPSNGDLHAWHLYVIRVREEAKCSRDVFIDAMKENGIGCSVHFIPLHLHPYWRETYSLRPQDFPFATAAYSQAVSLPLYSRLSSSNQDYVIQVVKSILS
jgi:dTDP-4-amino-4,6-dideoxygalactose transaminase